MTSPAFAAVLPATMMALPAVAASPVTATMASPAATIASPAAAMASAAAAVPAAAMPAMASAAAAAPATTRPTAMAPAAAVAEAAKAPLSLAAAADGVGKPQDSISNLSDSAASDENGSHVAPNSGADAQMLPPKAPVMMDHRDKAIYDLFCDTEGRPVVVDLSSGRENQLHRARSGGADDYQYNLSRAGFQFIGSVSDKVPPVWCSSYFEEDDGNLNESPTAEPEVFEDTQAGQAQDGAATADDFKHGDSTEGTAKTDMHMKPEQRSQSGPPVPNVV